jgi:hypothetical protein
MLGVSRRQGLVMPRARNSIAGSRVCFEGDGGSGAPVVFYGGLMDSVEAMRLSPIAQALPADQSAWSSPATETCDVATGRTSVPRMPCGSAWRTPSTQLG